MKVVENEKYNIYVYAADHNPPHCHVRRNDDSESVVSIPDLQLIVGKKLEKDLKRFLTENIDIIIKKWIELEGVK